MEQEIKDEDKNNFKNPGIQILLLRQHRTENIQRCIHEVLESFGDLTCLFILILISLLIYI